MTGAAESALGLAAHDIRSPLAIVSGYLKLLSSGNLGELTADQRDVIAEMERASRKIVRALDDLSDLANFERRTLTLDLGPTTFGALIDGVGHADGDDSGGLVLADARRMRRAIDAVQARLAAEVGGKDVPVTARVRPDERAVWAEVLIGPAPTIDAAVTGRRGKLVDLPASGPGGLSLLLARKVIEAHGGTVRSLGQQRLRGVIVRWPVEATQTAEVE